MPAKTAQKELSTKKFKHPSMFYFFTKLPKFHLDGRAGNGYKEPYKFLLQNARNSFA